jgi:hypothetical protein
LEFSQGLKHEILGGLSDVGGQISLCRSDRRRPDASHGFWTLLG